MGTGEGLRQKREPSSTFGSSNEGDELNDQLSDWMNKAPTAQGPTRAIIAPHAGYYYCGECSGHVYKQIDASKIVRVFILGPSHHARLAGCALSGLEKYETPFYHLTIDSQVYSELYTTGEFESMSQQTDEAEHSIEMQLPYIAKVMESRQGQFTIVPVMVGSLSTERELMYGHIFSKYLADPANLFVISSDFCHWGSRFHYNYYDSTQGAIWQSIEHLDRMGMEIIERMDRVAFRDYLKKHQNTICGKHPIGVLLSAITALRHDETRHQFSMRFLQYAQSSRCETNRDSSVSYAAAILTIQ